MITAEQQRLAEQTAADLDFPTDPPRHDPKEDHGESSNTSLAVQRGSPDNGPRSLSMARSPLPRGEGQGEGQTGSPVPSRRADTTDHCLSVLTIACGEILDELAHLRHLGADPEQLITLLTRLRHRTDTFNTALIQLEKQLRS